MVTDPATTTRHRRVAVVIAALLGGLIIAAGMTALFVIGGPTGLDGDAVDADLRRSASSDAASLSDGYRVWARNDDGRPVRWDPCRPIDLVIDDRGAPDGFQADLRAAIARLEAVSGLTLRITGATDERPAGGRPSYQPTRYGERWAPVLVAWAEPQDRDLPLHASDRGVAIPVAVGTPGDQTYVTGQVVFNRHRTELQPGDEDRATSWGATILHELAHLVGLGHVDDPNELMYTYPGTGPVELGPGDTAGLRSLGSSVGCLPPPRPGPVQLIDRS